MALKEKPCDLSYTLNSLGFCLSHSTSLRTRSVVYIAQILDHQLTTGDFTREQHTATGVMMTLNLNLLHSVLGLVFPSSTLPSCY